MATPANSTRTSVAHRRTDINPCDLPERYVLPGELLSPFGASDEKHIFSTVEVPKAGEIIAIWRTPETLLAHEHRVIVYRLLYNLNAMLRVGDMTKARTIEDIEVYVEPIDKSGRYRFFSSEIEAIHKWIGPLRRGSGMKIAEMAMALEGFKVDQVIAPSLYTLNADVPLTMSSREIAELTGKNHADVMRDIRNMLRSLNEGTASKFAGSYKDPSGKSNPVFNLPKRESLILVSGYRVDLRAKIIDRWMELEEAVKQPVALALDHMAIASQVAELLEARFAKMLPTTSSQPITFPYGKTSGEIWYEYGLPTIKNGPLWLGNRLEELGCLLDGSGKCQLGRTRTRVFDPAKVKAAMRDSLIFSAKQYAARRLEHPQMQMIA